MKILKTTIFLICCFCFAGVRAQIDTSKYKIKQGPVIWVDELYVAKILALPDSGALVIKYKRRDLLLELFNGRMQLIKSTTLEDLEYEGKRKYLIDAFEFHGRIYFQFRQFDKKAKILRTIIEELDYSSLNLIRVVDFFNTDAGAFRRMSMTIGHYNLREKYEMKEFGSSVSENGQYKLFYTSSFDMGSKVLEKVKVVVFDSDMNKIREDDFVLPHPNGYFFIQKVLVDNSGNAFLLGAENYDLKHAYQKPETPTKYHLMRLDRSDSVFQQCSLIIDNVFMNEPDICFSDDESIVISGFYGIEDKERMHGIYMFKVDKNEMKVVFSLNEEFDLSLVHKVMTKFDSGVIEKLEQEGKKVGLTTLLPVRVIPLGNGDWILLSEYGYSFSGSSAGPNSSYQSSYYFRGDIVVFKFDQSGTLDWATSIDKAQNQRGYSNLLSYVPSVCEDKLFFIYNSDLSAGTTISLAVVDAHGEVEYTNIKSTKNDATAMNPMSSIASDACGFFLYFEKGKKYRLGILDPVD